MRVRAVRQHAQVTGRAAHAQEQLRGAADDRAVRDDQQVRIRIVLLHVAQDGVVHALGGLRTALAAGRAHVSTREPCVELLGPLLGDLLAGVALPVAHADLAQPRVVEDRQAGRAGDGICGLGRAAQVRGHDRGEGGGASQMTGDGLGLGEAQLVEGDVDVALEATHGVVLGAAVAQQCEGADHCQASSSVAAGASAGAPAAATASATSTTGQSFQRRSSA